MVPDLAIVGNGVLDAMSAADKATFLSLCKKMSEREFALWGEATEKAKQTAIAGGAHFSEVDITPFQNNCLPLHESLVTTKTAKDLYNSIRSLSK
jgi:TRAP-type C4-dicarboxylate transport system substrate-binding protein